MTDTYKYTGKTHHMLTEGDVVELNDRQYAAIGDQFEPAPDESVESDADAEEADGVGGGADNGEDGGDSDDTNANGDATAEQTANESTDQAAVADGEIGDSDARDENVEDRVDDLTDIKYVGPATAERLDDKGFTSFETIRNATVDDIAAIDTIKVGDAEKIKENVPDEAADEDEE